MNVYGFLTVCAALQICCGVKANSTPGDVANMLPKTINFVEVIKKDLLSNNDDYIERANRTKANVSYTFNGKEVTSTNNLAMVSVANGTENKQELKSYRRMLDNFSSEYDYNDTPTTTTKKTTLKTNKTNTHAKDPKSNKLPNVNEIVLHTLKSSTSKTFQNKALNNIPKFVDKNKIDKFKQFMEKNKGLFKEYMSRSRQQGTKASVAPGVSPMPSLLRGHQGVAHQGQVTPGLLPRDMLDMLPAKGGRVYKQRMKGRLCHRHVLVPEGPKYDSAGRWYLAAHPPAAPRPYPRTRRPRLLLPRCCNCCKKSVLGCE